MTNSEGPRAEVNKYNLLSVAREVLEWVINGRPVPPPHYVKVLSLCHILSTGGYQRFIETGTLAGSTTKIVAQMPGVQVDTIEIDETLWRNARYNFSAFSNVTFHLGDSTYVLPQILSGLSEPALFWLDAHHSGGRTGRGEKSTPVSEEIRAIVEHPISGHAIVIDDMRGFRGSNDYPRVDEVVSFFRSTWPEYSTEIRDDLMYILPANLVERLKSIQFSVSSCPVLVKKV